MVKFAPGICIPAVKNVTGERDDVLSTSLKADMSADEFAANFRTLVEPLNADDSVILLADILSGSPFTNALAVLDEKRPDAKHISDCRYEYAAGNHRRIDER